MSTDANSPSIVNAGEWISFYATLTVPSGVAGWHEVKGFGDELQITERFITETFDRLGRSWLVDLIDDEAGQIERYGRVAFRRGRWPAGELRVEPGTVEYAEARELASRAAWAELDPDRRARALLDVERRFGPINTTSRTLRESTIE